MEQFKLKVERCFALLFNNWGRLICLLQAAQPFLIEQALAIVQQCNDHTGKHSRLNARIVELPQDEWNIPSVYK